MNIPSRTSATVPYQALSSYLAKKMSLQDTLKAVNESLTSAGAAHDPTESLSELWYSLLLHASETSHSSASQDALVDFLLALRSAASPHPVSNPDNDTTDAFSWKSLPGLGHHIRDTWNFPHESGNDVPAATTAKWINANAFLARYTAAVAASSTQSNRTATTTTTTTTTNGTDTNSKDDDDDGSQAPDYSIYALYSLRAGLEAQDGHQQGAGDASVAAAAAWLLYARDALHGFCDQHKNYEGKRGRAGPKYAERDWSGFSVERWRVWGEEVRARGSGSGDGRGVRDEGLREIVREAGRGL